MFRRWVSTVFWLRKSAAAISGFVLRSTTRRASSSSRSVSARCRSVRLARPAFGGGSACRASAARARLRAGAAARRSCLEDRDGALGARATARSRSPALRERAAGERSRRPQPRRTLPAASNDCGRGERPRQRPRRGRPRRARPQPRPAAPSAAAIRRPVARRPRRHAPPARAASARRPRARQPRVSSSRYFARHPPGSNGIASPPPARTKSSTASRRLARAPAGRSRASRLRASRRSCRRGPASDPALLGGRDRESDIAQLRRATNARLRRSHASVWSLPGEARGLDRAVQQLAGLAQPALCDQSRSPAPASASATEDALPGGTRDGETSLGRARPTLEPVHVASAPDRYAVASRRTASSSSVMRSR